MQVGREVKISRGARALSVCFSLLFCCCNQQHRVYESNCNPQTGFKKVSFRQLIGHLPEYDKQLVEVTGRYEEDKEWSALVDDSLLRGEPGNAALWVNFTQDCPLYLSGTRQGLFEYSDAGFTRMNNRSVTLRGKIDMRNKGSHQQCKAAIDHISLVRL